MFESKICIFKWPTHMVSCVVVFFRWVVSRRLEEKSYWPSWKGRIFQISKSHPPEISCETCIQKFNAAICLDVCRSRCLCLNGSMTILHNLMCCFFKEWLETPLSFENSLLAPGHVHFETSTIFPPNKYKQLRLRTDSESTSSSLASRKQKKQNPRDLKFLLP